SPGPTGLFAGPVTEGLPGRVGSRIGAVILDWFSIPECLTQGLRSPKIGILTPFACTVAPFGAGLPIPPGATPVTRAFDDEASMERYRISDDGAVYFVTMSVVDWLPVFISEATCRILTESLNFCHRRKGLRINAYVVMPTHFHAIVFLNRFDPSALKA